MNKKLTIMPSEQELLERILEELRSTGQDSRRRSWSRTFYAEQITTKKIHQIAYSSNVPLSSQRDIEEIANGGSITDDNAQYTLKTGTQANGQASLQTVDRTLYIPGSEMGWGVGVRPLSLPQSTAVARFGLLIRRANGDVTGMYYRLDSDGIWAVSRDDATGLMKETPQSQWNIDQLDGDGYGNLNLLDGNMFRGKMGYYGYTPFRHEIGQSFTAAGTPSFDSVPVNIFERKGGVSISTPNLPIRVEVDGGADGEDLELEIGGRQAVTLGEEGMPERRITGIRPDVSLTAGTFYPMVAFKTKPAFEEIRKYIGKIFINANSSGIWRLVEGAPTDGTLDTPPYGYSASEVGTNFNVTGTTSGAVETITSGLFSGSKQSSDGDEVIVGRPLKEDQDYTLEVNPNANGSVGVAVPIREFW